MKKTIVTRILYFLLISTFLISILNVSTVQAQAPVPTPKPKAIAEEGTAKHPVAEAKNLPKQGHDNPPGATTLIAPNATVISTNTPTYIWTKIPDAVYYYLWVNGTDGKPVIQLLIHSDNVCGATLCAITPTKILDTGHHTWYIQTRSATQVGLWSGLGFTVSGGALGKAVLTAPIGAILTNVPTFVWHKVTGVTHYYLWLNGPGGTALIKKIYNGANICNTTTCSIRSPVALTTGAYTWFVQTLTATQNGPWSSAVFNVSGTGTGFNTQFNADMSGWEIQAGNWWIDASQYLTTDGSSDGGYSSVDYAYSTFANLDYQVRVTRNNTCLTCQTYIIIRGTPTPLNFKNEWYSGYQFGYSPSGTFSVRKGVAGAWITLKAVTASTAVNGNFNTLRVVASGSSLLYYINGTLVWSGVDTTYTTGRVGITAIADSNPNNRVWIDWASLNTYNDKDVISDKDN